MRLVTVDPGRRRCRPTGDGWSRATAAWPGCSTRVEVAFGREAAPLEVSPGDRFIATTWWTAHIAARRASEQVGGERFLYLIQEYEPFTFPMGTYAALAAESYALPPHARCSPPSCCATTSAATEIGVFAPARPAGDRHRVAFQNAITAVTPPTAAELRGAHDAAAAVLRPARGPRRAATCSSSALLALAARRAERRVRGGWELRGIGTVGGARTRIALGGGAALELLPRADQGAYAQLLREHDVGLALMYTPHPSLVPIEMASAGMLTVTNTLREQDRRRRWRRSPPT